MCCFLTGVVALMVCLALIVLCCKDWFEKHSEMACGQQIVWGVVVVSVAFLMISVVLLLLFTNTESKNANLIKTLLSFNLLSLCSTLVSIFVFVRISE